MQTPRTQLLLPDGIDASAAADQLARHVAVVTQRAHRTDRTFWDTFDGRLHGAGLALVDSGSRFALTDAATNEERAAADHPRGLRRLAAVDLPADELRERLEPIVEMRVLTPIVRVRSRLLPVNVLDDLGKVVVRLQAEEPTVLAGGDVKLALRSRLNVTGVLGYEADYERVLALLTVELGARAGVPAGPGRSRCGDRRRPRRDVLQAARRAVGRCARGCGRRHHPAPAAGDVDVNLPGTLADTDSEYLHDLRVAVRRSRALQRELRGVFAPEPLRVFRAGFRELQVLTGPTRDLDVQLLEFGDLVATLPPDSAADVAPLRALLELRLAAERATMVRGLKSERTRALLRQLARLSRRRSSARPRTTAPTPRGRSPRSPASGSARCTGRW